MADASAGMRPLRRLGRTKIEITPIGLGCWQFSEGKGVAFGSWSALSRDETTEIIQAAIDGGMSWCDTAEIYGFGRSERAISRALQVAGKTDGDVVIATKWNPFMRRAGSIKSTIVKRQACLHPFRIDLHQVHSPASLSSTESEMEAMADLVDEGAIRAVGVSNFSASRMRRAHQALLRRGVVLASNQVKYSVMDRRIESNGVLGAAKELGVTIIAYSPLEMGLLSGKFHKNPDMLRSRPFGRRLHLRRLLDRSRGLIEGLEDIAATHGVTASQVALNWLVHFHGDTVVAIPGATKPSHARESAGALKFSLSREEMASLDELSSSFLR